MGMANATFDLKKCQELPIIASCTDSAYNKLVTDVKSALRQN